MSAAPSPAPAAAPLAVPPWLAAPNVPERLDVEHVACAVCGARDAAEVARAFDYEYRTSRQEWTYVRCRRCSLVYLDPRPAEHELRRIYPPHYYSFVEEGTTPPLVAFFRRRLEARKVADFRRLVGDGERRVLDVGCGDGRFLSVLRAFGPPAWRLAGIDIDEGAVARARAAGFDARLSRLEDFRTDERYDLIVLFQVLEHVARPAETCALVRELLAPGGVFVVETPDVAGWDEALFRRGLWGGYHVPRHWNLFTPATLGRMLAAQGFEVLESRPLVSTSFWINSLYNWALVHGAPERVLRFLHFKNPALLACFLPLDRLRIALGGRTSNQRVVARRPAP